MGTLRVCSYFAGMKGNPIGGVLFNHVPFSQARPFNQEMVKWASFEFLVLSF
jgi:hypothetical protein